MSPSPLSTTRCTTGGTSSRRWIIAALVVALVGLGVPAFADGSPAKQVNKLKPVGLKATDEPQGTPASVGTTSNDNGGRSASSPLAPPVNDECEGAIVIPDGPYPVTTAPIDGIDATPQGTDEGIFSCAATDYTVWYKFTPSVSGLYTITTCPASGAVGNTVLDTVIALYTSTGGACPAVTERACNDSSGCATPGGDFSVFSTVLTGGQTYFIAAGDWQPGGGLTPDNSEYVIHIERSNAPSNDTCAGAIPLPMDRVVEFSTAGGNDDYQSPATAACFAGIGQTPSTSPGRDVAFTFHAPADGLYSIRQIPVQVNGAPVGQNPTIYASNSCPGGGGPVTCIDGSGGNHPTAPSVATPTGVSGNRGDEAPCFALTAGQDIYVFFDDGAAGNDGGIAGLEVTTCQLEVEPNDTLATATPYNFQLCGNNEAFSSFGPTAHCNNGPNVGAACKLANGAVNPSLDCGPLACFGGPTPGAACTASAQCGAGGTCGQTAGCFTDSVCIGGATPGAACGPRCTGGPTPGLACSASGQCGTGGLCSVSGGCGACVGGPTPGNACTANANCGTGGTCNAGLCDRRTNEGDVDFWSLGDVPAGNKIWVGVEAVQANDFDFRMRITSTTETLGFDDDDATALQGGLSAVYSGAKSTGGPAYARVSRTTGFESGPYRLYANVTPPLAQAQPEANGIDSPGNDFNWPGDGYFATYLNNTAFPAANGFVSGQFAIATDTDCWQLLANEGDDIAWWADGNPNQVDTASPAVPQFIMYDAQPAAISNFVFGTGAKRQLGPYPGAGLDALTPQNTSFFMHWRARYTGAFELCAYSFVGVFPEPPPYPKFYAGSITVNCQPPRPAGPGTSTGEVSITKSGPAGPVPSSSLIDYTITVTHSGNDIAQGVQMVDTLPPELVFIGLSIEDGLGGNNTACISLPSPGTADAPIDCMTMSMAPGATTVYTVTVKVVDCLEGGTDILNTATIASTVSIDPDDSNNSASWTFTSSANSLCSDLFCDTVLCIENLCTLNDHCEGNVCVTTLNTCNDNSVCTNDSCAIATGVCTNDGTPGAECSDGNPCTADLCDPVDFCVFPPAAQGIVCDDFFGCTNDDVCDGQGNCAGLSVCSDGNACTDDFADENDNCACSHEPTFAGAPCSDGDACTTDDTCDGANTCVAGTGTPDCNDNNPCTDDSCDPNVGCVNTNNSNPCDDGNACTTGDACGGGSCQSGGPLVCNDGNDCTDDSCNPASGCVYTDNSNACDDGNACTVGDSCGGGTCNGGAPVVCTASDQCHDAGVCNPGSGTCSNPAKADGTTCDDGNPNTSGDNCQAGVCTGGSTCPASPNPKSKGYYKKLCNNNHSGDSLTDADAQCVASLTVTFSSFSTVNDICSELSNAGTGGDTCAKERDQLLVVALNICKERLCQAGEIDSRCNSGSKTVGQSLSEMDVIFSNPNSSANTCSHGGCLGEEINTGRALKLNSLSVSIQAGHAHLSWDAPVFDDGTNAASSYTIWRRPQGSEAPFQQIGATTDLLFVDTATGSLNWQYEVLTIEPQP